MSWKNVVPKRECDFELETTYQPTGDIEMYSDFYYVRIKVWIKEEKIAIFHGRCTEEPSTISVDSGLKIPYRINTDEWNDALAEAIILGA